jgi:hypothetical protein
VAPHPDVFFEVAKEEGERIDDRLAVRHESRARAALEAEISLLGPNAPYGCFP